MPESFDMFSFVEHLRRRWRILVLAGSAAIALAMVVSLLTPNEYTATARVMIQPPAGGDVRARADQSPGKPSALALETAEIRLEEAHSAAGYRGERLKVIDPGVVPERPSRPNVSLNVFAALLFALVASLLYLAFDFHYST